MNTQPDKDEKKEEIFEKEYKRRKWFMLKILAKSPAAILSMSLTRYSGMEWNIVHKKLLKLTDTTLTDWIFVNNGLTMVLRQSRRSLVGRVCSLIRRIFSAISLICGHLTTLDCYFGVKPDTMLYVHNLLLLEQFKVLGGRDFEYR